MKELITSSESTASLLWLYAQDLVMNSVAKAVVSGRSMPSMMDLLAGGCPAVRQEGQVVGMQLDLQKA